MTSRLRQSVALGLLLGIAGLAQPAWAAVQDSADTSDPVAARRARASAFMDSVELADRARDEARESLRPAGCLQDPELRADSTLVHACARAYHAYYEYQTRAYAHRSRVFAWQYHSSIVVFIAVIALVSAGVVLSWRQFNADAVERTRRSARGKGGVAEEGARSGSQLKASLEGIEISSPVIGLIILTLSLLFFYLYLKFVYPITETF